MSPHNDIMALTEAGEDARGLRAELFSLAQVCGVCAIAGVSVCLSLGYRSPPGLCETKVNPSKTKTKPDHQQYEAEGRPFGCCRRLPARWCLCVEAKGARAEGRYI